MVNEEQFVDEDVEEIAGSEEETDLVTKLISPMNLLLLALIAAFIVAIILMIVLL
jgi:hypothetical protein